VTTLFVRQSRWRAFDSRGEATIGRSGVGCKLFFLLKNIKTVSGQILSGLFPSKAYCALLTIGAFSAPARTRFSEVRGWHHFVAFGSGGAGFAEGRLPDRAASTGDWKSRRPSWWGRRVGRPFPAR
jgi:hypothetical protein